MQLDPIKVTDYMKTEESAGISYGVGQSTDSAKEAKATKSGELKSLSVDNAYYNKKGELSEDEIKNNLEQASSLGVETVKQVENIKHSWDSSATEQVQEDGQSALDMDVPTIVTVVDEIKMNIAKAGGDVSAMGGLSDKEIEAMSMSYSQAVEMEKRLDNTLTDEAKAYLVKNELEPTIANIYNAQYSAPEKAQSENDEELIELLTKLGDKLDELIEQVESDGSYVDNNSDIKEVCGKMLASDVPLTKENLEYMIELDNYEKPTDEEVEVAIADIVAEGKQPKDAYLVSGYSLMDQAREKVEEVQAMKFEDLFDVQSRITLTEVQLSMTVEATFTMMKNGVEVNTSDLSDLLDKLKIQETSLLRMLMKAETDDKTAQNVNLFQKTISDMADIIASPAQMLGRFSNIGEATFTEVHEVSISVTAEFSRMEATYEAVGTEVRKDLGDSMNKAFSNIDDILKDLDLDEDEANEKAVRILAYNEMEITKESVLSVKASSELVNRTFKNMTPAVVAEMIKRGENPLDMKMDELNEKTQEIKTEIGDSSDSESFAKFLWKAEKAGDITDEERESFIGVYRLLHQVEKGDGAAIGALMGQGVDVTLRNLMTAVRSDKHSGREYEVSDQVGALEKLVVKDLSITEQIEKVFLTNRCRDALDNMSPNKMQELGEETYLEMNPDQFATAMEDMSDEAAENLYTQNITDQLLDALDTEKEVYEVLDQFNIPTSANMINAVESLLENNNQVMKELFGRYAKQEELDIHDLIDQAYAKFAEACSTPEEMAEAEEALGVLAENIMKTMMTTEDVNTIDFDDMKLVVQQTRAMERMADSAETYHIPIMVADEAGNMNLKIVRGTGESGLIKMALYLESTGTVSTTFRYENGQVNGNITCETAVMREQIEARADEIAATMEQKTGFTFSFSFVQKSTVNVNEIYKRETGDFSETTERNNEVQTEALYSIARGFINVIGEMFS